MGPNNWGIFLILPITTGEGIGPAGEISPVVCMLKNGLGPDLLIVYLFEKCFKSVSQSLARMLIILMCFSHLIMSRSWFGDRQDEQDNISEWMMLNKLNKDFLIIIYFGLK